MKFTWKSVLGAVVALGSTIAASVHALPADTAGLSTLGGFLAVAADRLADAKDFATLGGADVDKLKRDLASAKIDAQSALAKGQRDVAVAEAQANARVKDVQTAASAAVSQAQAQVAKAREDVLKLSGALSASGAPVEVPAKPATPVVSSSSPTPPPSAPTA